MQHTFLKGTVTLLLLLLVTSLALGADNQTPVSPAGIPLGPSVPNLINFQGRLTDASGNPVADGSHTVNFTLWTLPTGGATVWTENTSQTTSGGLFTHNLGSITTLDPDLLQFYDSLYLQIVADGQTISPRIRLTSTSFSHVSGALEVRGFDPTIVAVSNFGHGLQTYGDDSQQQIRLWGESWGEIFLHDADVGNELTALLTSSADQIGGGGGALWLQNDAGTTTISLEGGTSGDPSVILPADAINASEMLNEPGVSNSHGPDIFSVVGIGTFVVDSVDITIPASGYVEVTCGASLWLDHEIGRETNMYIESGKTRGVMDAIAGFQFAYVPSVIATSFWSFPCVSTRLYSETAGTHRYYLHAQLAAGTGTAHQVELSYIRAKYFPTLYGTVTLSSSPTSSAPDYMGGTLYDRTQAQLASQPQIITVEEHNARLEAEVAKVKAEMEARLQKIEQQLNKTTQAGVEE